MKQSEIVFFCMSACGVPVHSGGWVAGDVIDESYVSLVQLECQGVVVFLIQQNTIVFICGHLKRRRRQIRYEDQKYLMKKLSKPFTLTALFCHCGYTCKYTILTMIKTLDKSLFVSFLLRPKRVNCAPAAGQTQNCSLSSCVSLS